MSDEIDRLSRQLAEARGVIRDLADAEMNYRRAHQMHGDGSIDAGRAWDKMRRAGERARKHAGPRNEKADNDEGEPIRHNQEGSLARDGSAPAGARETSSAKKEETSPP